MHSLLLRRGSLLARSVGRILPGVPMIDQATNLRQQGWNYKEISRKLGVSVDWCKRNLKGIKKGVSDPLIHELIQAAIRPEGCTHYEAAGIVYKHYGEEEVSYEKIRQHKRAAVAANPNCIFRPTWMSPTDPQGCTQSMLQEVSNLWDRITDATMTLCEQYPDAPFAEVQKELLALLSDSSPEGTTTRCERNINTATALSNRTSE